MTLRPYPEGFNRVYHLGTHPHGPLFVRAEFSPAVERKSKIIPGTTETIQRLSLVGVIGPKKNGDARGSSGQIRDELQELTDYSEGWDAERVRELVLVWRRWHLNDMRPGCVHQRNTWNESELLELVTYRLTPDAMREQREIAQVVTESLRRTGSVTLTPERAAVLALPFELREAPDADGAASGRYQVHMREKKAAGWVRPQEHPGGLLTKPCETCGYKYGTRWLYEYVPAYIQTWLHELPAGNLSPAWC